MRYHPYSNSQLLWFYGFAVNNNPHDTLNVTLQLRHEEEGVRLQREMLLTRHRVGARLELHRSLKELPWNARAYAVIASMPAAELSNAPT